MKSMMTTMKGVLDDVLILMLISISTYSFSQGDKPDCEYLNVDFELSIMDYKVTFAGKGDSNIITKWYWNFGNGEIAEGKKVVHTYAKSGEYEVCLKVIAISISSPAPCTKIICKKLKIEDRDETDCNLTGNFQYYIDGSKVKFKAESNKENVQYFWSFQSGTSIVGSSEAFHDFLVPGEYEVCLHIVHMDTKCRKIICKKIIISSDGGGCGLEADFEYRIEGTKVFFKAKANKNNVVFRWNFGTPNTTISTNTTAYDFGKQGEYEVCVIAHIPNTDCSVKICKKIVINTENDCGLEADFEYIVEGTKVRFSANSNNDNTLYFWSFNTINAASNQQTIVHDFKKPGIYEVCLTAFIPNTNCRVRVCKKVIIKKENECGLEANFEIFKEGNTVRVHAKANQNAVIFNWEFGNGESGVGEWASVTYNETGVYIICLTAYVFETECKVRICKRIIIRTPKENSCKILAQFVFSIEDNNVKFKARVLSPDLISSMTRYQFSWDFGDGNTGEGDDLDHQYDGPGDYKVCLTVTDTKNQCSVRVCKNVVIGRMFQDDGSEYRTPFEVKLSNQYNHRDFQFIANKNLKGVEIFDMSGQRIKKVSLVGKECMLNCKFYRAGIYFARFESESGEVALVKLHTIDP